MCSAFCMTGIAIAAVPLWGSSLMDKVPTPPKPRPASTSLGLRGPNAGITPTAGVYSQDDTYFHSGKIGGGTTLPTGGLSDFFQNSF